MEQKIREILAAHGKLAVDVASLSDDSNLFEAGLTSHASVNVMLACEDEFDVEFPDEALKKATFASIDALSDVVGRLVDESA
ncbi:acyl carrier protein [Tsukamurella soli]|uniref:Acyl carrier protein n=1 Tax=Tsukamurella soli TaxID=644556 RepID=A0ABP8JXW9_9ACTN